MATSSFYSSPFFADRGSFGQAVRVLKPLHLHANMRAHQGATLPKFVIEREIPGAGNLSDAQLREISQKSVNVLKGMGPEIHWLHSYVTGDKVYCVYLAPDEAAVREHARRGGFPANRISAVRRLIDPTTAE
jgi:Protein of unknown function (DUF4242)